MTEGHLAAAADAGRDSFVSYGGRTPFGIDSVRSGAGQVEVKAQDLWAGDFGVLTGFSAGAGSRRVLLVAPLAGAHPLLLRDLVVGLLPEADVMITDWREPFYIPVSCGAFGLADNIAYVVEMLRAAGPDTHVVGVCQGTVTALAATALLSELDKSAAPRTLTLIAGPIDPLANPTRVVQATRSHAPEWFHRHALCTVPGGFPGAGRLIYPSSMQLATFSGYLARHWGSGEIFWKLLCDDGADPLHYPFLRMVTQLMNLPAELVLDTVQSIFVDRLLQAGTLTACGKAVAPAAIRRTALMTVEGEEDDIAAPGQTLAAHDLCTGVPSEARRHLRVPRCGHFGLFHGARLRSTVLPAMLSFFRDADDALH